MPRPLRLKKAGACYHVISRGLERRRVFDDERANEHFVELLGEAVERFRLRVHAYVLMGNHYHLLLHTQEANLSEAMKMLGQSYTQWFNRRRRRVGPLWQDRYKAQVVDWQEAGLEVSRYVHLNPVRVRALGLGKAQRGGHPAAHEAPGNTLVDRRLATLREYRWSSYRAYAGLWAGPPWLEKEATLALLARGRRGEEAEQRAVGRAYAEWLEATVREGGVESPWKRLRHRLVLGGEEFVRETLAWLEGEPKAVAAAKRREQARALSWERIVEAVEAEKGERWSAFVDRRGDAGRAVALWVGHRRAGLKQSVLGAQVGGVSHAAVSQDIAKIEAARQGPEGAAKRLWTGVLKRLGLTGSGSCP